MSSSQAGDETLTLLSWWLPSPGTDICRENITYT